MDFEGLAPGPLFDAHMHFSDLRRAGAVASLADRLSVERIHLLSLPGRDLLTDNVALMGLKLRHPRRTFISGALGYVAASRDGQPLAAALAGQVTAMKALGFDGLKLIEGKPAVRKRVAFALDGPEYAEMWSAVEALDLPVVWHVADPPEFWDLERCPSWARLNGWWYVDGKSPSRESLYAEVERVLDRHPRLRVVLAHFCFLSGELARAAAFLDAHPDVCFDLTPGVEMYHNLTRKPDESREFFLRYQDRLIYGTDTSSTGLREGAAAWDDAVGRVWTIRRFLESEGEFALPPAIEGWLPHDLAGLHGLALPPEALDRIYRRNAERVLGVVPAPIEAGRVVEELERLLSVHRDRADTQWSLSTAALLSRLRDGQGRAEPP